ncbi:MAG: YifB family Mg chelatase-like AAA ATPase [Deltaproteobacteria bacterium]|nr:YifB family Mg chelatase-like AAA ATPase [Deltaproteobacteria bacterium]
MIAKVLSASLYGIDALPVEVQAQPMPELKQISIVGLGDGVIKESRDRLKCAINNSGLGYLEEKLLVCLSPVSLPKYGSGFDLAMALSILASVGKISEECLAGRLFLGELSLSGEIRPIHGIVAAAALAKKLGSLELVVPVECVEEARLVADCKVSGVSCLNECVLYLRGEYNPPLPKTSDCTAKVHSKQQPTFADVVGQHGARRALSIAAAGNHNMLMVGPPGAGKSMLAQRLPSILPDLTTDELIEVIKVYHALKAMAPCAVGAGHDLTLDCHNRPFRSPHHTTSYAGLIGGGSLPVPGEISLAHKGVLFLDEIPEFRRDVIETLRTPMETRQVVISRARMRLAYPADFLLIAAMNPCPCGHNGNANKSCSCSPQAISRYQQRLSGPFLDRIDLRIWVPPLSITEFAKNKSEDTTEQMKIAVSNARLRQRERFCSSLEHNANMGTSEIKRFCRLTDSSRKLLEQYAHKQGFSARSYTRILRVARTIADLGGGEEILDQHVAEALSYRA